MRRTLVKTMCINRTVQSCTSLSGYSTVQIVKLETSGTKGKQTDSQNNEYTYTQIQVQRLSPVVAESALRERHEERVAGSGRGERGLRAKELLDAQVAVESGRLVDRVQENVVRT